MGSAANRRLNTRTRIVEEDERHLSFTGRFISKCYPFFNTRCQFSASLLNRTAIDKIIPGLSGSNDDGLDHTLELGQCHAPANIIAKTVRLFPLLACCVVGNNGLEDGNIKIHQQFDTISGV